MKNNNSKLWVKEWFTPDESHSHRIAKYIIKTRTRFQDVVLAETCSFGRCLILDGEMQSASLDEFIYHESLVYPAMLTVNNPEKVIILGGGEGATLREVLKHKKATKAIMVDIDGEVVDFCRKYLKEWHQGSMSNPRAEVIINDAAAVIMESKEIFDVIISDLPTAIEGGPAYKLYTLEFYKELKRKLAPGGAFVLQAGSGNILQIKFHSALYTTLRQIFKIVRPYYAYVPSFDVPWAFLFCSDRLDPAQLSVKQIERKITENINGNLRFYDGITHVGLFHVPKYLRTFLQQQDRMITEKKPVFFYK